MQLTAPGKAGAGERASSGSDAALRGQKPIGVPQQLGDREGGRPAETGTLSRSAGRNPKVMGRAGRGKRVNLLAYAGQERRARSHQIAPDDQNCRIERVD